jgi:hypothetical protein
MDNPQIDYETLTGTKPQARVDAENLDLLALFHYILGAITVVFSSFFIMEIVMGVIMAHHPSAFFPPPSAYPSPSAHSPAPGVAPASVPTAPGFAPEMGYLFAAMGTIFVLGGWTLGGLTLYAGRCLKRRTNSVFIQVVAGLNCAFVQSLGTALGVFTFIVLNRPSVKVLFPR